MSTHTPERHFVDRIGWLRAAVLGANDGIVSTASLIIGVASAGADRWTIVLAGVAGLVAGGMSMAAGEYVSVSSQSDTERADLEREMFELENQPEYERRELARIYEERGLDPDLALKVADQLTEHDALGAHARDELGISHTIIPRPLLAAASSSASFIAGASLPLVAAILTPMDMVRPVTVVTTLVALAILGVASARTGGAKMARAMLRVTFWGAMAMAATAAVGHVFGITVG